MYAEGSSTISVYNCTFQGNAAVVGYGGVFVVTESTLMINSSTFANNSTERGGVIYAKTSNAIVIMDSYFVNNSANILSLK